MKKEAVIEVISKYLNKDKTELVYEDLKAKHSDHVAEFNPPKIRNVEMAFPLAKGEFGFELYSGFCLP